MDLLKVFWVSITFSQKTQVHVRLFGCVCRGTLFDLIRSLLLQKRGELFKELLIDKRLVQIKSYVFHLSSSIEFIRTKFLICKPYRVQANRTEAQWKYPNDTCCLCNHYILWAHISFDAFSLRLWSKLEFEAFTGTINIFQIYSAIMFMENVLHS